MKTFIHLKPALLLAGLFIFGSSLQLVAQCNVNEKYDKIISGYHSSIALKDSGTYAIWGSAMSSDGATDVNSPQNINVTNYPGLTGTVLKAAVGGSKGGATKDQAVILTTDGLWAWGITGSILSSSNKSSAAFGRTYNTVANGFNTYGLPTGVNPSDVQSMFASYQTLLIVTKITAGGNVWILTQASEAAEGNNGTAANAGSSVWKKVMKSTTAGDYLSNVVTARGQVSSGTYNAFIAQTSSGTVYTWGNSTFLGNGSASAARTVATQMTLPQESGSAIVPKMIGVTGGIGSTSTTKNTYYVLSNAGNLYALGDNTQKQCGDFTVTDRTSWVQVKKTAAANDYLTNINTFSCQEHNSSYPAIGAITTSGIVYTWGNDNSGMIGRTSDGTAGGTVGTSYDPGTTVDFSGTAVSIEMGGHTMLYIKTGSSQFCYVGHYTNGSMGAGTGTSTVITPNCSTTPVISICGYVPTVASTVNSTISAATTTIAANGSSTTTITIQLKDASGNNLTTSGGTVTVNTTAGTVGTVIDNNNGTYTVILTSAAAPASATISYAINGTAASNTASVNFTSNPLAVSWGNIYAYRVNHTVKILWNTLQEINVSHFDVERSFDGREWEIAIPFVPGNNLGASHAYAEIDPDYLTDRLYYRIKQTDKNGRTTYSPVCVVSSDNGIEKIVVYPVPVQSSFHIDNIDPKKIRKIEMITLSGSIVRTWFSAQETYDISGFAKGLYIVKVTTVYDNNIFSKLTKQ